MIPRAVTFLEKAQVAWGEAFPSEIRALAEYADTRSAKAAATAIGMSPATVSHLIAAKTENHDLQKIYGRIRGALMGETVSCEVWGEIGRDRCLSEQALPFSPTNSARAQCFRACRSGCPHSRLKGD